MAEATFVVFLILKLVGVIDWSWWLVTIPAWFIGLAVLAKLNEDD
ncbi:hypothetical protein [Amycolatopsis sp.]|nr:hypothetical protein [Amycolatopsis sp.]HVV11623.1 hypothetical protein [Amycolatopsis sp.]